MGQQQESFKPIDGVDHDDHPAFDANFLLLSLDFRIVCCFSVQLFNLAVPLRDLLESQLYCLFGVGWDLVGLGVLE